MSLSLMEIDILNHTGCKWSKTLYPGFRGNRLTGSNLTSPNNQKIGNFNSEFEKVLGSGLRSKPFKEEDSASK